MAGTSKVTVKAKLLGALLSLLPLVAVATDLHISMTAPTTYTSGVAIPSTDTITCTLYGANQGAALAVITTGPCTTFTRTNVDAGTVKCYSVSAHSATFNTDSAQVTPVCVTIPLPSQTPAMPAGFSVTPSK